MPDGEKHLTDEQLDALARQILEAYLAQSPEGRIGPAPITEPWWDIKGNLHNPTGPSMTGSEWWLRPGAPGPAEEVPPRAQEEEPPEVDWTVYEGQVPDFIIEMAKGMFVLRDMYGLPVYSTPAQAINESIALVLNAHQLIGEEPEKPLSKEEFQGKYTVPFFGPLGGRAREAVDVAYAYYTGGAPIYQALASAGSEFGMTRVPPEPEGVRKTESEFRALFTDIGFTPKQVSTGWALYQGDPEATATSAIQLAMRTFPERTGAPPIERFLGTVNGFDEYGYPENGEKVITGRVRVGETPEERRTRIAGERAALEETWWGRAREAGAERERWWERGEARREAGLTREQRQKELLASLAGPSDWIKYWQAQGQGGPPPPPDWLKYLEVNMPRAQEMYAEAEPLRQWTA